MSNTKTEAQRLADWADDRAFSDAAYCNCQYNAIAAELRRLDALCDERGTNEARMLMRLTEMQKQVDQLQAEAGQFKALAKANADALGASLSERDQLRAQLAKAVAEERKPLTEVEMEKGREQLFSTNNPYCPCDRKTFKKVAEWVERHHGIDAAIRARSNT